MLSYAEIKAVATGNPLIREHAEVAAEVTRLTRLATNHTTTQRALPGRLAALRDTATSTRHQIDVLTAIGARLVDTHADKYQYTNVAGATFTDRSDAGEHLRSIINRSRPDNTWKPLGTCAGVGWEHATGYALTGGTQTNVRISGDTTRDAELHLTVNDLHHNPPHVIATRLERHADKTHERLAGLHDRLAATVEQTERGQRTLGQPFAHQTQLDELAGRLIELDAALTDTLTAPPTPTTATIVDDALPPEAVTPSALLSRRPPSGLGI